MTSINIMKNLWLQKILGEQPLHIIFDSYPLIIK